MQIFLLFRKLAYLMLWMDLQVWPIVQTFIQDTTGEQKLDRCSKADFENAFEEWGSELHYPVKSIWIHDPFVVILSLKHKKGRGCMKGGLCTTL